MIKLGSILYEVLKDKRAILFAGPAGAGKSTIIKNYIPPEFQEYVLNSDKYYEPELAKIGGGSMKQASFTADQFSQAGKAMAKATAQVKQDYAEAISRGRPIIMDITGGSKNTTTRKKNELENAGYAVMMVMVYTSSLSTLKRNASRDRSLKPAIILRSWKDVVSNVDYYHDTFGDAHFILVNNNGSDSESDTFSTKAAEQYINTDPDVDKLTPQEKEVLEREFNALIAKVNQVGFTPFDELDTKIKSFLKVK